LIIFNAVEVRKSRGADLVFSRLESANLRDFSNDFFARQMSPRTRLGSLSSFEVKRLAASDLSYQGVRRLPVGEFTPACYSCFVRLLGSG
jgi:hypothetical protein